MPFSMKKAFYFKHLDNTERVVSLLTAHKAFRVDFCRAVLIPRVVANKFASNTGLLTTKTAKQFKPLRGF
jgi:hypothetical protein